MNFMKDSPEMWCTCTSDNSENGQPKKMYIKPNEIFTEQRFKEILPESQPWCNTLRQIIQRQCTNKNSLLSSDQFTVNISIERPLEERKPSDASTNPDEGNRSLTHSDRLGIDVELSKITSNRSSLSAPHLSERKSSDQMSTADLDTSNAILRRSLRKPSRRQTFGVIAALMASELDNNNKQSTENDDIPATKFMNFGEDESTETIIEMPIEPLHDENEEAVTESTLSSDSSTSTELSGEREEEEDKKSDESEGIEEAEKTEEKKSFFFW